MSFIKLFTSGMALALFVSSSVAHAEGKIAIGPQAGITFPEFKVTNTTLASQYGNKNGWLGGIFLEAGVWMITLRPELNYVTKGYSVGNTVEVKNHYLEVPVLVKVNPLSGALISPFIVVGPQWSKQIKSEVTVSPGAASYTNTADDWDLSGVAGLGIEFNISENIGLNVQGRYSYGFRDVDSTATEIKTRGFYALAGLSFQNAF